MTNPNQPLTIHALVPNAKMPDHYLLDDHNLPPRAVFVQEVHRTHEGAFHAIGHQALGVFNLSVNKRVLDHPLSQEGIVFEAKPVETDVEELNGYHWLQIDRLANNG